MTKHKKFHSLRGKGKAAHMYAVIHQRNPYDSAFLPVQLKKTAARLDKPAGKSQALSILEKKAAPSAANTESGKGGKQGLPDTVSTSTIHENGGNVK